MHTGQVADGCEICGWLRDIRIDSWLVRMVRDRIQTGLWIGDRPFCGSGIDRSADRISCVLLNGTIGLGESCGTVPSYAVMAIGYSAERIGYASYAERLAYPNRVETGIDHPTVQMCLRGTVGRCEMCGTDLMREICGNGYRLSRGLLAYADQMCDSDAVTATGYLAVCWARAIATR